MSTIQVSPEVLNNLVNKAWQMLDDYDGQGIDTWDAVMLNDKDGYDINVYQESEVDPLFVTAYEVKDLEVVNDYRNYLDLSEEI
jgi:hypothetical protein